MASRLNGTLRYDHRFECFRSRIIDVRVCRKTDSPGSRNSVGGLVFSLIFGYKERLGSAFHLHRNAIPISGAGIQGENRAADVGTQATLRSKTLVCYHYRPYLKDLRNVRRYEEYVLPVVFRPRDLFHLRAFCSSSVVISLSDADLTALKFLGPGEYLRPFTCVSLTYRYAPRRCSGGHRFHHVHQECSSVLRM